MQSVYTSDPFKIPVFSEHRLILNLQALAKVNPQMAERLTWPVQSSHIRFAGICDSEVIAEINFRDTGYAGHHREVQYIYNASSVKICYGGAQPSSG